MLTETEEVGGPEEKMERLGVLKSDSCCGLALEVPVRSNSAAELSSVRGVGRREAAAEASASRRGGEFLVDEGVKVQVDS